MPSKICLAQRKIRLEIQTHGFFKQGLVCGFAANNLMNVIGISYPKRESIIRVRYG